MDSLQIEDILKNIPKMNNSEIISLNWDEISSLPGITIKHVVENINLPWRMYNLSMNQSLSIDDIFAHPNLRWYYHFISKRSDITIDVLNKYPNVMWDWRRLTDITHIETIIENGHLKWSWDIVSMKELKIEHISINNTLPWDWKILSRRVNIEDIKRNPQLNWDTEIVENRELRLTPCWRHIFCSPHIILAIIGGLIMFVLFVSLIYAIGLLYRTQ